MRKYSIAIYGSSLREDFDKYSDKDLLVVADSYCTIKELKKRFVNTKWSVSFYTYDKLQYLANIKSLFVKHLQNEAKILEDSDNRLYNIIKLYSPKDTYEKELMESVKYFEFLRFVPMTKLGLAWFCDCFYVGLRNFLIFKNANNSIYTFSFNKLLDHLLIEDRLSIEDVNVLKELRVVKRNYRENVLDELPSVDFIQKIQNIGYRLGLLNGCLEVEPCTFQHKIRKFILSESFNSYQRLRLVEGFYVSQNIEILEIKKIISNPQFYACKMKDENYTMKLLNDIDRSFFNTLKGVSIDVYKNKCER